jgi:xanthine dehydrogenase accessory factor
MNVRNVLVLGGGDIASAVAHRLHGEGLQVLLVDRAGSPHARRGMAFTDALYDGEVTLDGVTARLQADVAGVLACWKQRDAIPMVTLAENLLTAAIQFDGVVDATMRRRQSLPDLRPMAPLTVGLGPGYVPDLNCHVAIETQWGADMGRVLRDRAAAERGGGPRALDGVTRERFVIAPEAGTWRTQAQLGQSVQVGDALGELGAHVLRAPIAGHVRGLSRDGVQLMAGQRVIEVDPRREPQIFGLGERPLAVARGVAAALGCA